MSAEVFTTQEVAEKFAVSVKTVNRWRRAGRFPGAFPVFLRDGGPNSLAANRGWRFPTAEVDRLMTNPSAPAPTLTPVTRPKRRREPGNWKKLQ